jgi:proteasome beta subunit
VRPKPPEGLPLDVITPPESFAALIRVHGLAPNWELSSTAAALGAPEGTTVIAFRYADGVMMAGDRRATAGHLIAHRRVQKVFAADEFSAVAISGTAGIAIELVKLFQTELEHYEKMEGRRLSLVGKANHLSTMVRRQLPLAMQGLVVIPIFCGYDQEEESGRLYSYDVVGGSYEETDYAAAGSGGRDARLYLRTAWRDDLEQDGAIDLAVAALVAAAEEDTATGGPDLRRDIYPNVAMVSESGFAEADEARVAEAARRAMGDSS